jgi:hypothetical protein
MTYNSARAKQDVDFPKISHFCYNILISKNLQFSKGQSADEHKYDDVRRKA